MKPGSSSSRPGLARKPGWGFGWIGELWQVLWIHRPEAKSGTWLEPAGLWHCIWQWWRLLHFNRAFSRREGFLTQWIQVKKLLWDSSHQTILRPNSKSISFQRQLTEAFFCWRFPEWEWKRTCFIASRQRRNLLNQSKLCKFKPRNCDKWAIQEGCRRWYFPVWVHDDWGFVYPVPTHNSHTQCPGFSNVRNPGPPKPSF